MSSSYYQEKYPVVILDDHPMFANSFALFLEQLGIFKEIYVINEEEKTIPLLINLSSQGRVFFFLDYILEEKNTLFLFNNIKRISKKVKTIFLTSHTSPLVLNNILSHKPYGIISKSSGTDIILDCIKAINDSGTYVCPYIRKYIQDRQNLSEETVSFTSREQEILQYFAKGYSIAETAEIIHLSRFTIVNHRSNMMKKSKTKSIVDLLAYARSMNLI